MKTPESIGLGRLGAALLAAAGAAAACSNSSLVDVPIPPPPPLDDQVSIHGSFCTEDPYELSFPVRVLFIVDTSQSMNVTDPFPPVGMTGMVTLPQRIIAVRAVIDRFINDPGVEYMIIGFNASATALTTCYDPVTGASIGDCFTSDRCELLGPLSGDPSCATGPPPFPIRSGAVIDLGTTGGTTNFVGALVLARQKLFADMMNSAVNELLRAKYVVVFVTDGLPDTSDINSNADYCLQFGSCDIYDAVQDIVNLDMQFELGDIRFHTVYLSGNTPDFAQGPPSVLLNEMANIGRGTYRDFGNGETINFLDIDFTSIRRRFAVKSLIASNINVRSVENDFGLTELSVDSDGDGLTDVTERLFGTDPVLPDSDGDGFDDQLEHTLRFSGPDATDPADGQCFAGVDDYDGDGDGMLDCEERFLGTNPVTIDSDADGVMDWLEVTNGTDPATDDALGDLDGDGSLNTDEIRVHLNPTIDDVANVSDFAYRYYLNETGIEESTTCYDFSIDNIRLLTTEAVPGDVRGWNRVYLYIDQVPFDDFSDYGTFRMACVMARFLDDSDILEPADALIEVTDLTFKKPVGDQCIVDTDCPMGHTCNTTSSTCIGPTVFDAAVDCVRP
jgi:hypothetical protein